MPPKGEKLTDKEIADLTAWVKMGAPDPRGRRRQAGKLTGLTDKARAHWAYQPVKKPAVPAVQEHRLGADAGRRLHPREARADRDEALARRPAEGRR